MAKDKKTILALCAHPDDAEIKCSGTLFLLKERGWDIHIGTFSTGDCGSAELSPNAIAVTRRAEAQAAAAYIGGTYHCLNACDLHIFDDDIMRGAATALIREVDPDCIITHYPVDYMPDHTAASAVVRSAVFTASMPNYIAGPCSAIAPTADMVPLYYFSPLGVTDFFGNFVPPMFYVDTSTVTDKKAEMLAKHASQRDWLKRQHGIDQYIEEMKHWDAEAGELAGVKYAEGFYMHKGHAYPRTPVIENALSEFIHLPK